MPIILGFMIVAACTFGGYAAMGGNLIVLWQPFEVVIIVGSAIGAFIVSNPSSVSKATLKAIGGVLKPRRHNKASYLELLKMLHDLFRMAKQKGWMAFERDIENPKESEFFKGYPKFLKDEAAVVFLMDYLRVIVMGTKTVHELEDLMEEDLDTIETEKHKTDAALQTAADGIPALGIVAAVLGVIKTMRAITEPPEVLGKMIGGALVGTFLGVFVAYGFVGPLASAIRARNSEDMKYYRAIKTFLIAVQSGTGPRMAAEYARKSLFTKDRPTFMELEEALSN